VVPDRALGLLVDAARDEALELCTPLVHDTQRGVAGTRQLAGGVEHATEHGVEIELGANDAPDVDQRA
jgi:hypothetical protein